MAKVLATIGGVAIAPGVSKNRRWYKPEHVASAVARARERLEAGDQPMVMLTHHDAGDDSQLIAARMTGMSLDEHGRARFTADLADTPAARNIASLADTSDGQPAHLKGVSIRGRWLGKVRKVQGPDGDPVETGDDLEIDGLDFTRKPGVDDAGIDTFSWAASGARETTERVLITESVEAEVTITEDATAPDPGVLSTAYPDLAGDQLHVFENGLCVTCPPVTEAKDPKKPYGDVAYADPGYQKDGKKRYPLDNEKHIRSAWGYINQAGNAALYTAAQLKRVKGRIKAAMKRIGAKVASESEQAPGWLFFPPRQLAESASVTEYYGDGSRAGSWSISASNGPVNLCLSSYSMDPADLDVILRAAADAACKALAALDPDMDGDVDVPGAGQDSDPDDDAPAIPPLTLTGDEHEPDDPAGPAESAQPAPDPAAGTTENQEDSVMPENTMAETATAAPAAGLSQADVTAAVQSALDAERAARKAKKKSKKAAAEAAAAETARIEKIVAERMAAERAALGETAAGDSQPAAGVAETDEQRVARLVEARVTEERQKLVASGQVDVGRKGVVRPVNETVAGAGAGGEMNSHGMPADWPDKPLHQYTPDERDRFFGPVLTRHVLGQRADLLS